MKLERWLLAVWYDGSRGGWWLAPLGWSMRAVVAIRRFLYRRGVLRSHAAGVPVIVVGNITAGGTGKTPVVIWLAERLRDSGFRVGVLTRGYRGAGGRRPLDVTAATAVAAAGDEAVLIARRTGVAVVASPDRVAGARRLVAGGAEVVVCDDGLQHYALRRDAEIAVVDGTRGFGNRRFIPAGPLRESPQRLGSVTAVIVNGTTNAKPVSDGLDMRVTGDRAQNLATGAVRPLSEFAGQRVHAIAGIGNPERFFDLLELNRLEAVRHVFADHAHYEQRDLQFDDSLPVLMTEKDAVKCSAFASDKMWCLPVAASFAAQADATLRRRLSAATGLEIDGNRQN